jgi:hypothetical protein
VDVTRKWLVLGGTSLTRGLGYCQVREAANV